LCAATTIATLGAVTEQSVASKTLNRTVAVLGAYGHTGRFVVAELRKRGLVPILSGRDTGKLAAVGRTSPGLGIRPASVDDPASLDRALAGAAAVINCAGPFAMTSTPVLDAALRAQIPYLDITAEAEVVAETFAKYADRARDAGIVIVPAMAFYGGLGDLLATMALDDWPAADRISIAYALSSWRPTRGTRATSHADAHTYDPNATRRQWFNCMTMINLARPRIVRPRASVVSPGRASTRAPGRPRAVKHPFRALGVWSDRVECVACEEGWCILCMRGPPGSASLGG